MNFKQFVWAAALAFTMVLWACSPESVGPKNNNAGQNDMTIGADNSPHPELFPQCSPFDTFDLAKANGDMYLNGTTKWGFLKVYNGIDENGNEVTAVDYDIAYNWFIGEITYFYGNPNSVTFSPDGVPVISSNWTVQPVNPVINAYQTRKNLAGLPNINSLYARVKVGQLDYITFDGSLDPNSINYLWIRNNNWDNPNSFQSSNSPFEVIKVTENCPTVGGPTTVTVGECRQCRSEVDVTFSADCLTIDVVSCKDLSNVVLVYDDCSWEKFDGLNGMTGTFTGSGANAGKVISHAYIKSGCYKSGEGPGFGWRVNGPCSNASCPNDYKNNK